MQINDVALVGNTHNQPPDGDGAAQTVASALAWARERLQPSASASLDAQLLLAHVLGTSRTWVLSHGDTPLSRTDLASVTDLIGRRRRGVPVAHLRGFAHWLDLELIVSPDVLIPRPETELLYERAVDIARTHSLQSVADIGTGSGALAIALARALPQASVKAVDISLDALNVARANLQRYGLEGRIELLQGDLIAPLTSPPDLIVANLPYLSDELMTTLPPDVRHEPLLALAGGPDGTDLYARLLTDLRERGWRMPLLLEIDDAQAEVVTALAEAELDASCSVLPDYAGLKRVVEVWPR